MSVLEARGNDEFKLVAQIDDSFKYRGKQQTKERESAFLKTLVEFVHADFSALRIPEPVSFSGMDSVDNDRPYQLTIQLTA